MPADNSQWFHAASIGDMVPMDSGRKHPTAPPPERLCLGCRCKISRYNSGEYCWPCSSAKAAPIPFTPFDLHPERRDPRSQARPRTYTQFKAVLDVLPADFVATDVMAALGISSSAVSRHLFRAECDGLVERIDKRKLPRGTGQHHGWVIIWRRRIAA